MLSKPSLLRIPLVLIVALSTVATLTAGCSKQGEGERCDYAANNHDDCDDGLVCVRKEELNVDTDRCCPPPGAQIGDERCIPRTGVTGSGGSSGGGSGGNAGTTGGNAGGGNTSGGNTSTEGGAGGSAGASEGGASSGGTGTSGGSNTGGASMSGAGGA